MEATLTLNQAGRQLGVGDDALTRLIRMGALPEARLESDDAGSDWVIPERMLPAVAARNGWSIDLRGARAVIRAETGAGSGAATGGDSDARPVPAPPALPASSSEGTAMTAAAAQSPAAASGRDEATPTVAEVIDMALLDRLLGAQEQRVLAETRAQEARHALAALNQTHNRVTTELEVERHERMVAADRYREERLARAASDAKVTELRNRVTREVALAEAERQARADALDRSARAERVAATAYASMGWLARRRFRRLNAAPAEAG